jgi:hypothetical protein
VIRETIRDMNMVAIGRVVLTSREHIIALEPLDKGFVGTLLGYPYKVRDEKEYFDEIQDVKVTKDMGPRGEKVVDLMDALKKSIASAPPCTGQEVSQGISRAEGDAHANRGKKDGQGNGREKVLGKAAQGRLAGIRRGIRAGVADRAEHVFDRGHCCLRGDAGRRILASNEKGALACVRISPVLHPAVLLASANGAAFEQNRPRPSLDRPEGGPLFRHHQQRNPSSQRGKTPSRRSAFQAGNTWEGFEIAGASAFPTCSAPPLHNDARLGRGQSN